MGSREESVPDGGGFMARTGVLLIEPDPTWRTRMARYLSRERTIRLAIEARDLITALKATSTAGPQGVDVIVANLDAMTDMRLWALLRIAFSRTSIIGLTEGKDERVVLGALAAGLSGLLRPDPEPGILLHAIQEAVQRRRYIDATLAQRARLALACLPEQKILHFNELTLDLERHSATFGGTTIHLTPLEFKVLAYLANNPGRIISTQELLEAVWGCGLAAGGTMHQVWQCVSRLRRKLGKRSQDVSLIRTFRGRGYMLIQFPDRSSLSLSQNCQEVAGS